MYVLIMAFFASVFLTLGMRLYLVKSGKLDIPNIRSSHSIPVPRGGGISIVLVFLIAIFWLGQEHVISSCFSWALIGGGAMIGVVGILDDHFSLSAWLRLTVHFVAAGWALWWLGKLPPLQLNRIGYVGDWLLETLALVGLVWLINLYNFMDGIDGLAGVEAVCISGLGGFLLFCSGLVGDAEGAWILAAACGGFLIWNWPPAKIFMGDVGSGFLGFVLGVFAVSSAKKLPALLWPWLILLSVFIVDSTVTLVRRIFSRARWYEAHCNHAYQHAARRVGSHAKVTVTVAIANLAWLFPLAWGAYIHPHVGPLLAVVAMLPLVYAAILWNAGQSIPSLVQ